MGLRTGLCQLGPTKKREPEAFVQVQNQSSPLADDGFSSPLPGCPCLSSLSSVPCAPSISSGLSHPISHGASPVRRPRAPAPSAAGFPAAPEPRRWLERSSSQRLRAIRGRYSILPFPFDCPSYYSRSYLTTMDIRFGPRIAVIL